MQHTFTKKVGATAVEPAWLIERGIDLPKRKIARMNAYDSRSCSPLSSRISYCSDNSKLDSLDDQISNDSGTDSMLLQYKHSFGQSSFQSFEQFFAQQDLCEGSDQLTIPSTIEAVEWMEVLSYFCGPNLTPNEIEDISRSIPRSISFTSLFRE